MASFLDVGSVGQLGIAIALSSFYLTSVLQTNEHLIQDKQKK